MLSLHALYPPVGKREGNTLAAGVCLRWRLIFSRFNLHQ